MNPGQVVKRLLQGMVDDRQRYLMLTDVLATQRQQLLSRDTAGLAVTNTHLMAIYRALSESASQRQDDLKALGVSPDGEGVEKLITLLPVAHQAKVSALWQELQTHASSCLQHNDRNGAVLTMQQNILDNMSVASEPDRWLY